MNINFNSFLLIIYSFIKLSLTEETSDILNTETSSNKCSLFQDCFNCSIIPSCRWNSTNEECIQYEQYNSNFSMTLINHNISNNITLLNNHFNFLRKVCFMKTTPMISNNKSKIYNDKSIEYCGEHYIMTSEVELKNNFKIELKNVNGYYATPNLLCEYIFFSGPDFFDIDIKINQEELNKFYLFYSEDSLNIKERINSSKSLTIEMNPNKINTLIFCSLQSFSSPPFTVTYKSTFWGETVKATGYIMLALIIVIMAIIIYAIIYMRRNSSLFKKKIKFQKKEQKKNQRVYNKSKGEEVTLMKKGNNEVNFTGPSLIKNFTPETPIGFLDKEKFSYEKCCLDGLYFNNKNDIYEAKCGHFYHKNCYNKLVKEMKESKDKKELKCVICNKDIVEYI